MKKVVTGDLAASEALATKRVMRHRGMTRKEAAAYVISRLGQGRAAGGLIIENGKLRPHTATNTPNKQQSNKDNQGNPAQAAQRQRMAEQKGNITNLPFRTSDKPVKPGRRTPGVAVPPGSTGTTPRRKPGRPPSTGARKPVLR